jgi:hypothetical protein
MEKICPLSKMVRSMLFKLTETLQTNKFTALLGVISAENFPDFLVGYFTGYAWTLGLFRFHSIDNSITSFNSKKLLSIFSEFDEILGIPIRETFSLFYQFC